MSVPTTPEQGNLASLCKPGNVASKALAAHWKVSRFHGSETKKGHDQPTDAAGLANFPFWRPPVTPNICAIFVDIDHPDAVDELFGAVVLPHIVIETPRGGQATWLIERVYTGPDARPDPITYAEAVGPALRASLRGDLAVDPLRPRRVRNPGYDSRDVMPTGLPLSQPWKLGEIRAILEGAGQWPAHPRDLRRRLARSGEFVGRKVSVNLETWLTIRYALEDGSREHWSYDDVLAVAEQKNLDVASAHGLELLPPAEVREIAGNVTRYQHRPGRRGITSSEEARELGRKGGSVRSEAKTAAARQNADRSRAVRSAGSAIRSEAIRALAEQGLTRAQIMRELNCSESTVKRALRDR